MMLRMSAIVIVVLLGSMSAEESSLACKPAKHYGVSGCELLPDQTCPPGYHKQAVGPSNPQMKSPTYFMCVADKTQPKKQPPTPKHNR
jgi:hypothetical protein